MDATPLHRPQVEPLKLMTYRDMINMPEPSWLVEGVLQERTSNLIFGKSNAFKSFLAIDLGLSVATGTHWHGNEVMTGNVLFAATESANGVGRLRIPAWYDHHDIDEVDRFNAFLFPKAIEIDDPAIVERLIQAMHNDSISLLVLDIFGGTMTGSESDDQTARAWVAGTQTILRETGATVLSVAHSGWLNQERARMHSHFWGSFDSRFRVKGDKNCLTTVLTVERHKDADSVGQWAFRLEKSGTSLVPVLDQSIQVSSRKKLPGQAQVALNALDDAIKEHGQRLRGENWPTCEVVSLECWKQHCIRHNLCTSDKPETLKKALQRVQGTLRNEGLVYILDGYVWRLFEDQANGTDRDKVETCPEMSRDRVGGTDRDTPL